MKKILHIALAAAAAALAAAGCAKVGEPDAPEGQEITITASFAEDQTKTTLQDGGTAVYWEAGDEIKVFYDGTGSRLTSTLTSPSGVSSFSGTFSGVIGLWEGFSDSTPLWGLYPYRSDATADNESVTTVLPSEQIGRAGSFAKGMNIGLAKSKSLTMGFYNVCGGVRFSVTRDDVKDVVFEALSGESVAGKVRLGFEGGVPAVQEVVEGEDAITLTAPAGGTFEAGKWYYIVALPGTLSGGFKMTFNTETKYAVLKSTDSRTIKRGKFGSLADADEDLVYKDKGTPEPGEDIIVFKDIVAKVACVEKFDTNGDGELSYDEAAAVTSIAGLFTDYNTVISFDELKYFTKITNLGSAFNGLKALKSVTLPIQLTEIEDHAFGSCSALDSLTFLGDAVSSIGQYAFVGCSSLKSFAIPSSVTVVNEGCFQGCSSLKIIDIPTDLSYIKYCAFNGCKALESINLPLGLKTVEGYAFMDCKSLKDMNIPDAVISVGNGAFANCTSLEAVVLPSRLSTIPSRMFACCYKLYSIKFPDSVSTIGDKAFYDCSIINPSTMVSKIDLPETITNIGAEAFNKVLRVLVHSNPMVSISSNAFSSSAKIYVPDAKVEIYKIRTNWSTYADHIFPLSTYEEKPLLEVGSIDLGLSVNWASCNMGACSPEEYGDHYAWGEVDGYYDGKTEYSSTTYKWFYGATCKISKYNTNSKFGVVDNKIILDAEDDVARIRLGGNWRIPTYAEWTELIGNCTWIWMSVCGVNGYLVNSKKMGYTDKSIFLPAAGYCNTYIDPFDTGSNGYYWSSSLCVSDPYYACCVHFTLNKIQGDDDYRAEGFSIRPVCDK